MFIIDFDDTLFDTRVGYSQARIKALKKIGISEDIHKKSYLQARAKNGVVVYDHRRHAKILESYGFDYGVVYAILERFTTKKILKNYLFPDSINFLKKIRKLGKKMILLSSGEKKFQKHKFIMLDIEKYFDATVIVTNQSKEQVLKKILKNNKEKEIWFINDKVAETLKVKEKFPLINYVLKQSQAWSAREYRQSGLPFFKTLTQIYEYIIKY